MSPRELKQSANLNCLLERHKPDLKWSAIDKILGIAANKLLKLCDFE